MNLIEQFENQIEQNVKTFNTIFSRSPIVGFSDNDEVEIGSITTGGARLIKINNEVVFPLNINFKKVDKKEKIKKIKKKSSLLRDKKEKVELSKLYKVLTPSQFMIYSAIKESNGVSGVEELARNISISNKTIIVNLKTLVKLKLIKKTLVSCESGTFSKLVIDTQLESV